MAQGFRNYLAGRQQANDELAYQNHLSQQDLENQYRARAAQMNETRFANDQADRTQKLELDQQDRQRQSMSRVSAIGRQALRLPVQQRKSFLQRAIPTYGADFTAVGADLSDLDALMAQDDNDLQNDLMEIAAFGQDEQPTGQPSSVQEWHFLQSLPEDQRAQFLNLKRQPTAPQVVDIGGVPHLVDRVQGSYTPLSSVQQVAADKSQIAGAEAGAKATATAQAEREAGIQKKGSDANNVMGMLDMADPLIDAATGSLAGAGRDALAGAFGFAPDGAQAIAQLKVLQAALMTNMPRMEGPQSDRDVQLYREAAGQIGDPTVPNALKKAAVRTIRQIQQKYKDRAAGSNSAAGIGVGQSTTVNGVKVTRKR